MTYNEDLQRNICTQMSLTSQTLSVLSQSLTLLSAQQNSLSRMFNVIQRSNRTEDIPVTLSFTSAALSDLYDLSSSEIPINLNTNDVHPILQNILNMVNLGTDTSNNDVTSNAVEEVSRVTQESVYSDINNPTSTVCPISLEPFESTDEVLRINRCGHYFKKSPLVYWFRLSKMCPVCRCDVTVH
tara:strand:+ start:16351 stop:16905 length:555 start_codon:yes stop_codon:yes gene_type:complete